MAKIHRLPSGLYRISTGMIYANDWTNPRTGELIRAHSLATRDGLEAETAWTLEKARHLGRAAPDPAGQLLLGGLPDETFAAAVAAYVARKTRWADETRARWAAEIPTILGRKFDHAGRSVTLGDRRILEFAGADGADLIQSWVDAEIARHPERRTHTVCKRLANLVKPALKLAWQKGWAGAAQFPVFPELETDYEAEGARDVALTRSQFVCLASELAHHDAIRPRGRVAPVVGVYPRLAAILDVDTGMHRYDVNRLTTADWDAGRGMWFRRNSKGARHYPPEWFPCLPMMAAALRDHTARFRPHYCARWDAWDRTQFPPVCRACGRSADVWVRDPGPGKLADEWMRSRLEHASKRARLPFAVARIDFRHTFATWRRDEGWKPDQTAKWLGNSSGMVERVYAQIANEEFAAHVEKASLVERAMLDMVAITQLGHRRGPRIVRTQFLPPSKHRSEEG